MYSPGPVACFSDEDDVSGNQNNCYWPLHSESIARCKHHMQEKLVYCCTYLEIYDFKIEVVPFIIHFNTDLTTVVKKDSFKCYLKAYCLAKLATCLLQSALTICSKFPIPFIHTIAHFALSCSATG